MDQMEPAEHSEKLRKAIEEPLERATAEDTDPLMLLEREDALRAIPLTDWKTVVEECDLVPPAQC
jgi:hypothetical protein